MRRNAQVWLTNLTRTMMQQIRVLEIPGFRNFGPREIWRVTALGVKERLSRMSDATLGEIACQGQTSGNEDGKTSIWEVISKDHLLRYDKGAYLVGEIATATIIARMHDLLLEADKALANLPMEEWPDAYKHM